MLAARRPTIPDKKNNRNAACLQIWSMRRRPATTLHWFLTEAARVPVHCLLRAGHPSPTKTKHKHFATTCGSCAGTPRSLCRARGAPGVAGARGTLGPRGARAAPGAPGSFGPPGCLAHLELAAHVARVAILSDMLSFGCYLRVGRAGGSERDGLRSCMGIAPISPSHPLGLEGAPRDPAGRPRWPKMAPRGPQKAQGGHQDGPMYFNMAQDNPRHASKGPKIAPRQFHESKVAQ